MHLAREMYRDVMHMETVEIPDEFFDKTFIRQLMLGTEEARRENVLVHGLHENHPFYSFNSTRCKGYWDIYIYGVMKYLTNLKNHFTMNLERFEKRVDSHTKSIVKASSELMHCAREMYEDVTHMEIVEVADEFLDKTFIRHLMLGTERARTEH
jgi:hypothetical protein